MNTILIVINNIYPHVHLWNLRQSHRIKDRFCMEFLSLSTNTIFLWPVFIWKSLRFFGFHFSLLKRKLLQKLTTGVRGAGRGWCQGCFLSFKRKDISFEYYLVFTVYEVNSLLTRITLALDSLSDIGTRFQMDLLSQQTLLLCSPVFLQVLLTRFPS